MHFSAAAITPSVSDGLKSRELGLCFSSGMHARCQVSRLRCLRPTHRYDAASPARIVHRHGFHTTRSRCKAVSNTSAIDSLYVDSEAPTAAHLDAAKTFFTNHQPSKSWTADEWRTTSTHSPETLSLVPEIAFLGRSNTGKSSLLNALLSQTSPPLCRVGSKPGKTTLMHAWSLTPTPPSRANPRIKPTDMEPKLTVLDMPGYGHGSHKEWGDDIMKYLTRRRQLRRAFVLINPNHGLKDSDLMTLDMLHAHGISHQVIACKCDRLKPVVVPYALATIRDQITKHFTPKGKGQFSLITLRDVLAVGALGDGMFNAKLNVDQMKGIDHVRWAVLRAAGLEDYALYLAGHVKEPTVPATGTPIQSSAESVLTDSNEPPTSENEQRQSAPIGISVADFLSLPAKLPEQSKNPVPQTMTPITSTRIEPTQARPQPPPSKPQPASPNIGIGIEALQSMTQPTKPKPKTPNIGIGIEALLEMTQPKPPPQAQKKQKQTSGSRSGSKRGKSKPGKREREKLREQKGVGVLKQAESLIART